jgi:RimJ/RimL family protein N-acetyltransferase
MVLFLQTTHLDLVAATVLHLDAELAGPKQLGGLLGVAVPKDWPPAGIDRNVVEHFRARLAKEGQKSVGWYGWYAICRRIALQPPTLVGACGFFGPPDDLGQVELGFTVLPAFRGRGHATEMVEALVAHALAQPGVQRITAHARAQDRPTLAVLLRSGFATVAQPEPGLLRCERGRVVAVAEMVEDADEADDEAPTEDDESLPDDDE